MVFKRQGGFSGPSKRPSSGGRFGKPQFGASRFGGKPKFGGGGRGGDRPERRREGEERELFSAVCSVCGKDCQVPFRPSGDRPVLCKECFAERGDFPSKDGPRRETAVYRREGSETRPSHGGGGTQNFDQLKRQLEAIERKLDLVLKSTGARDLSDIVKKVSEPTEEAPVAKPKKRVTKRAPKSS